MASATAFTSLSVPVPEDTMEMSSPAGHTFDNDIDIDFDDYQGGIHLTDDEHMLEDGDQMRLGTATDEMMDDEVNSIGAAVVEEVMQDDLGAIQVGPADDDDELIDYGDEEYQNQHDSTLDDTTIHNVTEETVPIPEGLTSETEQVHHEIDREPQPKTAEELKVEHQSEVTNNLPEAASQQNINSGYHAVTATIIESGTVNGLYNQASKSDAGQPDIAASETEELLSYTAPEEGEGRAGPSEPEQPPRLSITSQHSPADKPDGPPTPTDTGIHPILICYGELEIPLFKSRAQPDGLLKDDNLVNLSLADVMGNCKRRLATKTGEVFSDDYELRLTFDQLGLVLVEDSEAAFSTSLDDVLQVYLSLHKNDGTEDVPALIINSSIQLKFLSSLNILKQAALHGQGISDFAAVQSEEFDDGHDAGEYDGGLEYADDGLNAKLNEGGGHYGETQFANEGDLLPTDPAEYENHQDEVYEETGEGQHGDDYNGNQYHDDGEANQFQLGEDFDEPPFYHQTAERPDESSAGFAHEESEAHAASEAVQTKSAAGPTTMVGNSLENHLGEYAGEDLIQWDDDDLITYSPAVEANNQTHDFEAGPEDFSAQGVRDSTTDAADEANYTETAAQEPSNDFADTSSTRQLQDEHFGDEDYLIQFEEEQEEVDGQEAYDDNFENDRVQEDEQYDENYGQADIVDNNEYEQEHLQPGDEEDDEQFHTAHDLLEGHETELGPAPEHLGTEKHLKIEALKYVDEDDIGFDDDDEDLELTTPHVDTGAVTSNSPLGKRSIDELLEYDDFDGDEPDPKRARPA